MPGQYAKSTEVPVSKSKQEIDTTLRRYGVKESGVLCTEERAVIIFSLGGKRIQIQVPMPDPKHNDILYTPAGRWRDAASQKKALAQAEKQIWRGMALYIKAGMEAIELGIRTIEEAFFYDILLPNGMTIGQTMQPELDRALEGNPLPPLLPAGRK